MQLQRRDLLKASVAGLSLLSNACGWILYPERKGRTSGEIDLPILIIDVLWLLPGLVPGAVCLAVDFTTGCIYRGGGGGGGGSSRKRSSDRDTGANDLPPDERPSLAQVTLDDVVVAQSQGGPDQAGRFLLVWKPGVDMVAVRDRGKLIVSRRRGATALAPIVDLI